MKPNYNRTITACFIGYIVQAIVNNFAPLLFLTFQSTFDITLSKITMLVTINFGVQLFVDLLSAGFVDKIGYRTSILIAHGCAAAGLFLLPILPQVLPDPFVGLLIAVVVYATGGGLLEVLVSPIVENCPSDNKEKTMSLLHSFYCWGHVGVVLISTLFFAVFGIGNWRYLAFFWALIPLANFFLFTRVPMASPAEDGNAGLSLGGLLRNKMFWLMMLMMVCSGASEQSVSQWASTFAELGLGVSKTIGDLAGPMFFAVMMGLSRLVYGRIGERINLRRFMVLSGLLCVVSYLIISLSPWPVLGLIGCGLCGLSVGIMWPGTFSTAAVSVRGGGTAMFAFLALAGDLGCSGGPTFVGFISNAFGERLQAGILAAVVFPVLLVVALLCNRAAKRGARSLPEAS